MSVTNAAIGQYLLPKYFNQEMYLKNIKISEMHSYDNMYRINHVYNNKI